MAQATFLLESETEADDFTNTAVIRARHFKNLSLESVALATQGIRIALYENPVKGYDEIIKSQEIALKSGDPFVIGQMGISRAYIERWLGQPVKTIESSEGIFEA